MTIKRKIITELNDLPIVVRTKNYKLWINYYGQSIDIKTMSNAYIVNVINMIIRSFLNYEDSGLKDDDRNKPFFTREFVLRHGLQYIIAFTIELKKRSKLKITD